MGWSAQYFTTIIIEGDTPATGIFIYNGGPGSGNLIGSWAAAAGTDAFGNSYPAGINVFQGQLTGVAVTNASINLGTIIGTAISNSTINNTTFTAGTISQTTMLMNSSGGVILAYTTTTTTTTYNTPGNASYTAGITGTASVSCWGSGAGGGGGDSSVGGETGGGGEFANEPAYPITDGNSYKIVIPGGGTGGQTGSPGNNGQQCTFDLGGSGGGVVAHGGTAGINFNGGAGGTGSANTVHYNGGNGADAGTSTGGSSGANSGSPTAAGNNGIQATSSSGAPVPTGQGNSGAGGAGGNNNSNGSNGATPGGSGGGAGAAVGGGTFSKTYSNTATYAYYGADISGGGTYLRNTNGSIYQGNPDVPNGTYPGDQYSFVLFNYNEIQSDLANVTITDIKVTFTNQHSWFNSGLYVCLGFTNRTSFPNSNVGWSGSGDNPNLLAYWQNAGTTLTQDVNNYGIGGAFKNGNATCLLVGPATPVPPSTPSLYDYGYFAGGAGSVKMQIIGTTPGGGSTQAGNGGNGQCTVTVAETQTLTGALSAVSGEDSAGNAYGAGYTGTVQAFNPSATPSAVESWHTLTLPSGLTGSFRYKLVAENNMVMIDVNVTWSTTSSTEFSFATGLAAPYLVSIPDSNGRVYTMQGNSSQTAAGQLARLFMGSAGAAIQILVPASSGGGTGSITLMIPQD